MPTNYFPEGLQIVRAFAWDPTLNKAIARLTDGRIIWVHRPDDPDLTVEALIWEVDGTITVAAGVLIGNSLVLKSPNGTKFKITVDNSGALLTEVTGVGPLPPPSPEAASGVEPIAAGVVSQTVVVVQSDATYKVFGTPTWNTVVFVTSRTTTNFVAEFSTPAPAGGGLLMWRIER